MHKDLLKKIKDIKEDDPFLITVTVFGKKNSKGKELDTFLFVNKFPFIEFEGTKKMISNLIDNAIKKNK
ncbi:MAG: hypothetical protein ABIG88_01815 [Patescibacteria group bacterium]|nr:hypothetical protein [Patescibacteria group bacterium]